MSGPAYPPGPSSGSNGIGQFIIGVSPVGTIPDFDVWKTVISQYANSPILMQLILDFAANLDKTEELDAFYDNIWNIATAYGYGLDVWGRIVGVNRVLQIQTSNWFGFEEALPGSYTFGQGAFYSGAVLTSNYSLADETYRRLILAKAAANITNGSIPAINRILMAIFPNRGNCYVQEGVDNGNWFGFAESTNASGFNQAPFYSGATIGFMEMTYVFEFSLTSVDLAIVLNSGVLPKSTGVLSHVLSY